MFPPVVCNDPLLFAEKQLHCGCGVLGIICATLLFPIFKKKIFFTHTQYLADVPSTSRITDHNNTLQLAQLPILPVPLSHYFLLSLIDEVWQSGQRVCCDIISSSSVMDLELVRLQGMVPASLLMVFHGVYLCKCSGNPLQVKLPS